MAAVAERLCTVRYRLDRRPHITLDGSACSSCSTHPCVNVCPAGCFRQGPTGVAFTYDGCLECGACAIVCDRRALKWSYPRGGFGVAYRFG